MARPKQLPDETIQEIRRLHNLGMHTQTQLAEMFNLSQSTVCKIVNNVIHKKAVNMAVTGEADVKIGMKYGD